MDIQCECGRFRAKLKAFPHNTPGRLVCYCEDCQRYLHILGRSDLLDQNGGTEVIPAYPADIEIISGIDCLKCIRLTPAGIFRFSTHCCNTPIVNTKPCEPWAGFMRCVYMAYDPAQIEQVLGSVRSRIMGRHATGTPPSGTAQTFNLKSFFTVMPFVIKGKVLRKFKPSPFFAEDGVTPITPPQIISEVECQ